MKRTQFTDLLATIRATIVSFFSIVMFVTLAVAVFLGIDWSGRALEASGEDAFEAGCFHDLEILFPYGLTNDDIAALQNLEGVSDVEAGQVTFEMAPLDNSLYSVRIASLGERIDKPLMVEGKLPSASNEIAIETLWARRHHVNVGDHLRIEGYEASTNSAGGTSEASSDSGADSANTTNKLACGDFTITALMENPAFVSNSSNTWGASSTATGTIDVLAWAPISSFNKDAYQNGSTLVTIRSDDLRGLATSSDEYADGVDALAARVSELGEKQAAARHNELVADAQKQLDEASEKLADARTKIADAEQAISDGETQIANGESQLAEGESLLAAKWSEYYESKASGRAELDEKAAQLAEAQTAYDQARGELDAKQAQLAAAKQQLDEEEAKLDPSMPGYEEARAAIEAKRQELNTQKAALDAAEAELATKKAELDSGYAAYNAAEAAYASQVSSAEAQLAEARATLDSGYATLAEGRTTLEQKRQELADAKKELASKEAEFADAQSDVSQLRDNAYSWNVRKRTENGGVLSLQSFVDIANRLRTSLASLFVLVGLFVCYSAVARLVNEQVRQIGAKKALGMRANEVTISYLLYTGIAVIAGSVLGVLSAVLVVERIIVPVLTSSFFMPAAAWWSAPHAIGFCALELVLILASTLLACRSVLRHHAVDLLAGGAPPSSKERFFEHWDIWQRLPLYTQTTVNNLLNDRRRVVGTLAGVAGCTALLVCAITLNNNVVAGFQHQYSEVYHYDTIVYANTNEEGALEHAEQALADLGQNASTPIATRKVSLNLPDTTTGVATITVPMGDDFSELVTLTSVSGDTAGTQIKPDDSGVWVSNAYADHYGAKPGDMLNVTTGNGTTYELPIAGFYRHYLVGHQVMMSADLYRQIFGVEATASSLLVAKSDITFDELEHALVNESCISAVDDDRTNQETLFNSFRKVSRVVVLVYLGLSVVMAIVVLLNLNVMFVEEKRRDLTTLMVCGYTIKDAKRYIWRDNVVLTIAGVAAGVVIGMIAGWFAVTSIEISTISLVKTPDVYACLIGIAVSGILSALMTLIALRRVSRLQLSDINRT